MPRPSARRAAPVLSLVALAPVLALALSTAAAAAVPCAGAVSGSGDGTYYYYTAGTGACGYPGDAYDAMVASLNPADYAASAMCGRWLRVTGPLGTVVVRVVDQAPDLGPGDIDLNQPAFAAIANLVDGLVPITWETVASPLSENVSIHVHPGSNIYYTAVQVRHHRYGIASVEFLKQSSYVTLPRTSWNYFVIDGSEGVSLPIQQPFTLRVTDVNGQQIVINGLSVLPDTEFPTAQQFPTCTNYVAGVPSAPGAGLALLPPSPNPFNPRTTISFTAPVGAAVSLGVYDLAGRRVTTLLDGATLPEGLHTATWDGRDDAGRPAVGGTYLLRLESGGQVSVQKALLLK